jgi:glycerol-3-phosphate dehydrogenase
LSESVPAPPPREQVIARIDGGLFDVLVIGGGIVGAGIARDAAMRGLSVALVERGDFASGTSSRSSRLLHGGLRYLAQGRLKLVREAGTEKMVLRRIAPHLTQPMPFVFPTYRGTQWKLWKLRIGVKLYDWLSAGRNFEASTALDAGEAVRHLPGVNPAGLTGAVRYFDAVTQDARLVIDSLRSAALHGATVLNYAAFESAERRGHTWSGRVSDRIGGAAIEVRARAVVNAAGAWANRFPQSRVKLRLTKGVHLVVRRERMPVPECAVMTDGPRILFAIPWGQRTILGTTDTDYAGDIDTPQVEPADVDYILAVVNRSFPAARVVPDDVVSTWAGLRPLIADRRGRPSDISRAHQIHMTEPGWLDVAGGKLTTYRLMAEQAVDRLVELLGLRAAPCATATTPLLPAGDAVRFSGVLPPEVSREAVDHFCRHEWAVHCDDVMLRRTGWRHYRDDADDVARQVRAWMAAAPPPAPRGERSAWPHFSRP